MRRVITLRAGNSKLGGPHQDSVELRVHLVDDLLHSRGLIIQMEVLLRLIRMGALIATMSSNYKTATVDPRNRDLPLIIWEVSHLEVTTKQLVPMCLTLGLIIQVVLTSLPVLFNRAKELPIRTILKS